jgi:hypothetical protein
MESPPDHAYDVFMSYHWRDHAPVEALALTLRDLGLRVFLDRWCLHPDRAWPRELEAVMSACQAAAICVGPGGMGPWQQREVNLALDSSSARVDFSRDTSSAAGRRPRVRIPRSGSRKAD